MYLKTKIQVIIKITKTSTAFNTSLRTEIKESIKFFK